MPTTNPNYWKEYYCKNRAKRIAAVRKWQKAHHGYNREHIKRWQKRNPEKWAAIKARKDLKYVFAKRFGGLREVVIQRDGEKCVLCFMTREQHRKKYGRDITVDHIDGRGRGHKRPNNSLSNLRTLCLVCNLKVAREGQSNQLNHNLK
jgi:hypothetical protein